MHRVEGRRGIISKVGDVVTLSYHCYANLERRNNLYVGACAILKGSFHNLDLNQTDFQLQRDLINLQQFFFKNIS